MLQRMTVPAIPEIDKWLNTNPGWHDAASISSATGYAYSTASNACENLVSDRKAIRDGAPHTKSGIKYHAITGYYNGFRLVS